MRLTPFRKGDTLGTFRNLVNNTVTQIESLDNAYVLGTPQEELEKKYIEKILIQPLILHYEQKYRIQGTYDVAIPYEGDSRLWNLQASTFSVTWFPEIEVLNDHIVFNIGSQGESAQTMRERLDEIIRSLSDAVNYLKKDVERHNIDAPDRIKIGIRNKKQKAQSEKNTFDELGLSVKDKP